jgi:flagellar hook-length control protein FliK
MNANIPVLSVTPQTNSAPVANTPAGTGAAADSAKPGNFAAALTVAKKATERKAGATGSAATGTDLPAGGNGLPPPLPPAAVNVGPIGTLAPVGAQPAGVTSAAVGVAGAVAATSAAALEAANADRAAATAATAVIQGDGATAGDLASSAGATANLPAPATPTADTSAMLAGLQGTDALATARADGLAATAPTSASTTAVAAAAVKQAAAALQRVDSPRSASGDAVATGTDAARMDPTRGGSGAADPASAAASGATAVDASAANSAYSAVDAAADAAAARSARDSGLQRTSDAKFGAQAVAAVDDAEGKGATGTPSAAVTAATAIAAPIAALATLVNGAGKHAPGDAVAAPAGPALTPASDGTGATLQLTPDASVTPAAGGSASAASVKIDAPVGTPQFNEAVANRVSWMAGNNVTGATLQVSPPQLGPIELRVTIEAGHAQVWMSSHNPATLDALQNSSPKLRDMLSSQGFQQVSVDVSQRSFQDSSSPYSQAQVWTPPAQSDATEVGGQPVLTAPSRVSLGVVDAYA